MNERERNIFRKCTFDFCLNFCHLTLFSPHPLASLPRLTPSPHSLASLPRLTPSPHSLASLPRLTPSPHSLASLPPPNLSTHRTEPVRVYFSLPTCLKLGVSEGRLDGISFELSFSDLFVLFSKLFFKVTSEK